MKVGAAAAFVSSSVCDFFVCLRAIIGALSRTLTYSPGQSAVKL